MALLLGEGLEEAAWTDLLLVLRYAVHRACGGCLSLHQPEGRWAGRMHEGAGPCAWAAVVDGTARLRCMLQGTVKALGSSPMAASLRQAGQLSPTLHAACPLTAVSADLASVATGVQGCAREGQGEGSGQAGQAGRHAGLAAPHEQPVAPGPGRRLQGALCSPAWPQP